MKSRTKIEMWMTAVYLFAALAMTLQLSAQDNPEPNMKHHKYRVVDVGTFGGPASYFNVTEVNGSSGLNRRGVAVGTSATSIGSDEKSNGWVCFGASGQLPYVFHAFEWKNNVVRDLGSLAGEKRCSNPLSINASGDMVGSSEINRIDPGVGIREVRAVLWKRGVIKNLGTLGGNHSSAQSINKQGQIVGPALNQIPDPYSFFSFGNPNGTQTRAFLWQDGAMRDLLTLGGPDSFAGQINGGGQVVGFSYTSYVPNPDTGIPTIDPFLWSKSSGMVDLGSFGGTLGFATQLNDRGQVSGYSNLTGDLTTHPFFWNGKKLLDLGTFGGSDGVALSLNDAGEVVGDADFPGDELHDGFLWKSGTMTDLGNLGKTSSAFWINSESQIVGGSHINDTAQAAFLWEHGGPMIDLNTLIPPDSPLQLITADQINDDGEIVGAGVPAGCEAVDICGHAYVLIPDGDCDEDCETRIAMSRNTGALAAAQYATTAKVGTRIPANRVNRLRDKQTGRYHLPSQPALHSD